MATFQTVLPSPFIMLKVVSVVSTVTAWMSLLEPKFAFAAENKVFDSPKATSLL